MKMITLRRIRRAGLTALRPTRAWSKEGARDPFNMKGPRGQPNYPVEPRGGFSIEIPRTDKGEWPAGWRVWAPTEAAIDAGLARLGFTV